MCVCVCVLEQRLETPLFLAVIYRHHFVVKYLSEMGATVIGHSAPGALDPILLHNLQTALQRVCADGQLGLVEQLLSECLWGAALQSLKVRGFITCIYLYECGRLLHACQQEDPEEEDHPPFVAACRDGQVEVAQYLWTNYQGILSPQAPVRTVLPV